MASAQVLTVHAVVGSKIMVSCWQRTEASIVDHILYGENALVKTDFVRS